MKNIIIGEVASSQIVEDIFEKTPRFQIVKGDGDRKEQLKEALDQIIAWSSKMKSLLDE
jgi:hypothetical protein